jgi:hypothetical protein
MRINEMSGQKIIHLFKTNAALNACFSEGLSRMKSTFPMDSHVNKFIVGLSCEYLFCHALQTHAKVPMVLCSGDSVRTDVRLEDAGVEYSIKFKTPTKTKKRLSVPNIRLVNLHGSKDTDITDDIFVVVSNGTGQKGKVVFLESRVFRDQGGLMRRRDGIDLSGRFVTDFMNDPMNADCVCDIDVPVVAMDPKDAIKIVTEHCLGIGDLRIGHRPECSSDSESSGDSPGHGVCEKSSGKRKTPGETRRSSAPLRSRAR